jgi:hypothetical protein
VEADGGRGAGLHCDFCAELEILEVCVIGRAGVEEARILAAHGNLAICGLERIRST